MAILVLVGVIVVVIAAIVLFAAPVRHAEAAVTGFSWRWRVRIGTRVWEQRKSKRMPSRGEIRGVQIQHADDPDKRHYTYEQRVWRKMRSPEVSGGRQDTVQRPVYQLRMNEEVRDERQWYKATFTSEAGRRYTARLPVHQWKSLTKGSTYRLGRNTFGAVRTVKPKRPVGPANQ
jgi:hypothetical protein